MRGLIWRICMPNALNREQRQMRCWSQFNMDLIVTRVHTVLESFQNIIAYQCYEMFYGSGAVILIQFIWDNLLGTNWRRDVLFDVAVNALWLRTIAPIQLFQLSRVLNTCCTRSVHQISSSASAGKALIPHHMIPHTVARPMNRLLQSEDLAGNRKFYAPAVTPFPTA